MIGSLALEVARRARHLMALLSAFCLFTVG